MLYSVVYTFCFGISFLASSFYITSPHQVKHELLASNCVLYCNIGINGLLYYVCRFHNISHGRHITEWNSAVPLSSYAAARAGSHFAASSFINSSGELFFAPLTTHHCGSTHSLSLSLKRNTHILKRRHSALLTSSCFWRTRRNCKNGRNKDFSREELLTSDYKGCINKKIKIKLTCKKVCICGFLLKNCSQFFSLFYFPAAPGVSLHFPICHLRYTLHTSIGGCVCVHVCVHVCV